MSDLETFRAETRAWLEANCPPSMRRDMGGEEEAIWGGRNFTFQNPIASNLSGLVDPSSHFLYSLLVSIDVFTIWTLLLAGIAFSCLTKVTRGTCLAVVFGWWVVFILTLSGIAAAFS